MIIEQTYWQNDSVIIQTTWPDETGRIAWLKNASFDWTVGEVVTAPTTPPWIFEPRDIAIIQAELTEAQKISHRRRLAEERDVSSRPHAVYVAFYGILPKVGMTQLARLETRLHEQGADAGFLVTPTKQRLDAREIEKAISFRYHLPEWRQSKEILRQWRRPVDKELIEKRANDLRRRLSGQFEPGPILNISHPGLPILESTPHLVPTAGHHKGTIIGAKGNHLVYQPTVSANRLAVGHHPLHVLRRTDLAGRSIQLNLE